MLLLGYLLLDLVAISFLVEHGALASSALSRRVVSLVVHVGIRVSVVSLKHPCGCFVLCNASA